MTTWNYTLLSGQQGTIRAADDDAAWNEVLRQMGQCPIKLKAIASDDQAVAA